MKVEWDAAKDRANQEKHGIGFREIRIISARWATPREQNLYFDYVRDER